MAALTPDDLTAIADRFKVLAEVARLRVLDALRRGPRTVTALMAATGLQQANLSRHLQQLHRHGFVGRTRRGTFIHYEVTDPSVFALCELMCGQIRAGERRSRRPASARPPASRAGAAPPPAPRPRAGQR